MEAGGPAGGVVSGPLAPFEVGFRAELVRQGYAPSRVRDLTRVMARLSGRLVDSGLAPGALTPQVATSLRGQLRGLGPVLGFLRGIGVVPAADSMVDATPVEMLLGEFRAWLVAERGLAAESVRCYVTQTRPFLTHLSEPLEDALAGLDAGQVTAFMLGHCRDRNPGSSQAAVTALRSLLRFVHVAGYTPVPLAAAVPAVAGWRLASLPRALADGQVQQLLDSCDVATVVGRRDHAVLLLLARLGLRGAEVAALELGDVDWHGGVAAIRGKGNRIERLPLPVAVGEALAAYVSGGRPRCAAATVFVTARAPYRGLSPSAVRQTVRRACRRAGLAGLGAHRLRHTLATDMLRAGSPLGEVGQVLRHRSQLATATYAKVDERALRPLARAWPEAHS